MCLNLRKTYVVKASENLGPDLVVLKQKNWQAPAPVKPEILSESLMENDDKATEVTEGSVWKQVHVAFYIHSDFTLDKPFM